MLLSKIDHLKLFFSFLFFAGDSNIPSSEMCLLKHVHLSDWKRFHQRARRVPQHTEQCFLLSVNDRTRSQRSRSPEFSEAFEWAFPQSCNIPLAFKASFKLKNSRLDRTQTLWRVHEQNPRKVPECSQICEALTCVYRRAWVSMMKRAALIKQWLIATCDSQQKHADFRSKGCIWYKSKTQSCFKFD